MFDLRTTSPLVNNSEPTGAENKVTDTGTPVTSLTFKTREMKTLAEIIEHDYRISEKQRVMVAVGYAANFLESNYESILAPFHLSVSQYNVLRILLRAHPEPLTMKVITERILDRKSDVSRLLDRLKKTGYITKKSLHKDNRTLMVQLTPQALNILEQIGGRENEMLKPISLFNDTETMQLKTLLLKIIKTMTTGAQTNPQPDMKHKIEDGVLVISPEGNWLSDQAGEPVFERLSYALKTGNNLVLFNLSRLNYMNSSGLQQLLSASEKIKQAGGKMALCHVPAHTQKLLQITRLENILNLFPDEEAALEFLKAAEENNSITNPSS